MIVVLTILKWIGIVLSGIVGVLLLLLALLLFVPVRYVLWVRSEDAIQYSFRFSWLFPLVYVKKTLVEKNVVLCILGIPIYNLWGREKEPEKKSEKKPEKKPKEKPEEKPEKEPEKKTEETLPEQEEQRMQNKAPKKNTKKKKQPKKKKHKKNRFSFESLSGIIKFIREEETKHAVVTLKKELCALLQYLSPSRLEGDFLIGTGTPASTGLLFGGISLIPAVYQKGLQLTPDFEEKTFRGEGKLKGRIRVIYFIRLVIRIYRDEELQRVWKRMNK